MNETTLGDFGWQGKGKKQMKLERTVSPRHARNDQNPRNSVHRRLGDRIFPDLADSDEDPRASRERAFQHVDNDHANDDDTSVVGDESLPRPLVHRWSSPASYAGIETALTAPKKVLAAQQNPEIVLGEHAIDRYFASFLPVET